MIRLENLSKSFGGKKALINLSLSVGRGDIYGLLGHNGAGKSTAFGIMLGQVHPDRGEAFIDGVSVQAERRKALFQVGAIFETPGFYDYLSGWRNLELFVHYSARVKRSQIEETVKIVGLSQRIHDPVRTYSHGMRQRLALAQALLPTPRVVLLDEPTEGLDPEGIHEIRSLIQRLNRERGLTVLLSSHLLSEVEQLCSRVAIINQGKLIFDGRWSELQGQACRYRLDVDDWALVASIAEKMHVRIVDDGIIELTPSSDIADFVKAMVWDNIKVRAVEPVRPNLEALYLQTVADGRAGRPILPGGSGAPPPPNLATVPAPPS